ncbi:hypothetical protein LTR49_026567 [Elasticomyces elasticus]|nr:hypothetical protein LTR49_026567 [Elasticomyces elasticus]
MGGKGRDRMGCCKRPQAAAHDSQEKQRQTCLRRSNQGYEYTGVQSKRQRGRCLPRKAQGHGEQPGGREPGHGEEYVNIHDEDNDEATPDKKPKTSRKAEEAVKKEEEGGDYGFTLAWKCGNHVGSRNIVDGHM